MASEGEPRRKRFLALGLAALLFASGAAAGIAVDRWVLHDGRRGQPWWERRRPEALAHKYREELGLDQAQARAVEEVLRRSWAASRRAISTVEPEIDRARKRGDDEIRALLRPEQRRRFDEMTAEQERRRAAMRKSFDLPSPPHPPRQTR